jgi:hypothetical protein
MSNGTPWVGDYDADRRAASAKVAKVFEPFKILLKTKDEPALLRRWIEHHIEIVGPPGILIFDHGSTDPEVEIVYREYAPEISVWRFGGFHNSIHHRRHHPELYEALKASCQYYIFLDTDEFLIHTDGSKYSGGSRIVRYVRSHPNVSFYPGVWLQNIMGYDDVFESSTNKHSLIAGLKWGKPILSSDLCASEIQMHNMQIFECHEEESLITNFLLLHRSLLSPSQRIKANMRKLVAYRVIDSPNDIDAIMNMRPEDHQVDTCQRFIAEVQRLSTLPEDARGTPYQSVKLSNDGSMSFDTLEQKQAFESFVINPDRRWVNWSPGQMR